MRKLLLFTLINVMGCSIMEAQIAIFNPGLTAQCYTVCNGPLNEREDKFIDGTLQKFFTPTPNETSGGFFVDAGASYIANRIEFTTANDVPDRDPDQFLLEGSNDGTTFFTITSGSTTLCGLGRNVTTSVAFSNSTAYSWYRISFTAVCLTGSGVQIAEVQLYHDSPLPVKLISFSAQEKNNNGTINWKLAQPEDGALFEIQKSTDGVNFAPINTQTGNNNIVDFTYIDRSLSISGTSYYRLKMTDNFGKVIYSNIAVLKTGIKGIKVLIYPNPAFAGNDLQISVTNTTIESLKFVNGIGQEILRWDNFNITGSTSLSLPANLPAGIYFFHIKTDKGLQVEKVAIK